MERKATSGAPTPRPRRQGDSAQSNRAADEGRPEDAKAVLSPRDLRRFYKVTLAQMHARWAVEGEGDEVQQRADCLRCLLAERGAPMLWGGVRSLALPVPEGHMAFAEAQLDASAAGRLADSPQCYTDTLLLSTALGATVEARVNLANDPPAARVREQRMLQEPPERPSPHRCALLRRPSSAASAEGSFRVRSGAPVGATPVHVLLYAPPGFGKTTLQHRLAGRGVAVADTDDVPGASRRHVAQLLRWTSVLTNRLDLLDPQLPTVAFVPSSAQELRDRGVVTGLSEEDLDYWFGLHRFPNHFRIVTCHLERSCVSDWIRVDEWPAASGRREGPGFEEEFLQKIRDLGGMTHSRDCGPDQRAARELASGTRTGPGAMDS